MRNTIERERIFTQWFILIFISVLCSRMVLNMQNTFFPLYIREMGYSKSTVGLLSSVSSIASIATRPQIGRLVDRGRTKALLIIGSIACIGGIMIAANVSFLPLLIVARLLYGMGLSTQSTAGSTIATYLIPESRMREGLGYFGLTASISQAIGPMIALSLASGIGFKNTFFVNAAMITVAFICGIVVKMPERKPRVVTPTSEREASEGTGDEERELWWHKILERTALIPAAIMALVNIATCAVSTYLTIYATEQLGIPNIGIFFTVQAISLATIRLFGSKLTSGKREHFFFVLSLFLLAACLVMISVVTSLWQLVVIAVFYGFSIGNILVSIQAMIILGAPAHRRGMANSTYFLTYDAGIAIGSLVWGAVADAIGTRYIYLIGAALPLLSLLIYKKGGRRVGDD